MAVRYHLNELKQYGRSDGRISDGPVPGLSAQRIEISCPYVRLLNSVRPDPIGNIQLDGAIRMDVM